MESNINNLDLDIYYKNLEVAVWMGEPAYLNEPPFHPNFDYPEYKLKVKSQHPNPAYEGVRNCLQTLGLDSVNYGNSNWNPLREIVKPGNSVVIKPNFVTSNHQSGGYLFSLITHPSIIRVLVDFIYLALNGVGRIIIADAPQMDCDFGKLLQETHLDSIKELYKNEFEFNIEILDLRDFWANIEKTDYMAYAESRHPLKGDPLGNVVVNLGKLSAFYGLKNLNRVYGADYNRSETISHHHDDIHEYSISKTILDADVVISVPKLKVHKKVGVTLNSKGMVGINTNKNFLVHYTIGTPLNGGDQFPPNILSLREKIFINFKGFLFDKLLAKQNPNFDKIYEMLLRFFKKGVKPWFGSLPPNKIILDAGNWYGNDSAWRMVVDLAKIICFSDSDGYLHDTPQRVIFSIVDGIIGGENNGPLSPDSKLAGVVVAGFNPLATDIACTAMMGFDYKKLKWIESMLKEQYCFDVNLINIRGENTLTSALSKPGKYLGFVPHIGWRNYLEKE